MARNYRVEPALEQRLKAAAGKTRLHTTDLVRAALVAYFARKPRGKAAEATAVEAYGPGATSLPPPERRRHHLRHPRT